MSQDCQGLTSPQNSLFMGFGQRPDQPAGHHSFRPRGETNPAKTEWKPRVVGGDVIHQHVYLSSLGPHLCPQRTWAARESPYSLKLPYNFPAGTSLRHDPCGACWERLCQENSARDGQEGPDWAPETLLTGLRHHGTGRGSRSWWLLVLRAPLPAVSRAAEARGSWKPPLVSWQPTLCAGGS